MLSEHRTHNGTLPVISRISGYRHMAYVAVRCAELFSVKLPKTSQHNFVLSDDGLDLSRPCDQILEFASAGHAQCSCTFTDLI